MAPNSALPPPKEGLIASVPLNASSFFFFFFFLRYTASCPTKLGQMLSCIQRLPTRSCCHHLLPLPNCTRLIPGRVSGLGFLSFSFLLKICPHFAMMRSRVVFSSGVNATSRWRLRISYNSKADILISLGLDLFLENGRGGDIITTTNNRRRYNFNVHTILSL